MYFSRAVSVHVCTQVGEEVKWNFNFIFPQACTMSFVQIGKTPQAETNRSSTYTRMCSLTA